MQVHSVHCSSAVRSYPFEPAYVDGSYAIRGAQQVSAVRRGLVRSMTEAMEREIYDPSARLRYGALRDFLVGPDSRSPVRLFTSAADAMSALRLERTMRGCGFSPYIALRSCGGREKRVDTEMAISLVEETRDLPPGTVVTLLAGDDDFTPAVQRMIRRGLLVDLVGWEDSTSRQLQILARRVLTLDEHFASLVTCRAHTLH